MANAKLMMEYILSTVKRRLFLFKYDKIAPVDITPEEFEEYLNNTSGRRWFFDYLTLVGDNAAPIESTKGINDVTNFFPNGPHSS